MKQTIRRLFARVNSGGVRLLLGFVMLTSMAVFNPAEASAQKNITVQFKNVPFSKVLSVLKEKTSYEYLYSDEDIRRVGNVTANFTNASLSDVLTKCLEGTNFGFKIDKNVIIITPPQGEKAAAKADITISGRVVDESGIPMAGVAVMIKGQRIGMATDGQGDFSLGVPSKNAVLVLSFLGMKTQEIKVAEIKNVAAAQKFVMVSDLTEVEEVVVTGYSVVKKSSFTGTSISVSRDDLMKVSKTNPLQALQAFDPSFRIQENSLLGSNPNALPELYIRGRSGIGTTELDREKMTKASLKNNPNQPLFILDGFPITLEKFYDLDMNRIQNVTIHKDAAATALYGSRAANGVVIVTTVPPKAGEVVVEYNMTATVTMPDLRDYNLMNAAEKLETERIAGLFIAEEGNFSEQKNLDEIYNRKLANVYRGVDTYWLSKPLRTALNHKHTVNVTGGVNDLRFGVDLSYNNDNGVMKDSYRDRMSAALTLDYRLGGLQIKNQLSYGQTRSKNSPYGSFSDYTKMLPYDEYLDENGNVLKGIKAWHTTSINPNPMYEATLNSFDKAKYDELVNNLSLQWRVNPYLLFKGQFSLTKTVSNEEEFIDPLSQRNQDKINVSHNIVSGELNTSDINSFSWDAHFTASYNRNIKKHNINALIGVDAVSNQARSMSLEYTGFPSGELHSPNYAHALRSKPLVNQNMSRLFGLLATANYSYNDIYLADVSVRMDGSSEFGADKRFAPFYSGGVGINIHNYEFMRQYDKIDILKLRASYGSIGKVNFSPFDAMSMYQIYNDEWYKTGVGASLIARENRNLGWEQTNNFDVGVDFQMFDGKIYLSGSFYNKITKDLVNSVTIPSSTGFTSYKDNVGEVRNRGFEISLRSDIIKSKDLFVSLFANMAHNKNRITKISDSMRDYNNAVQKRYEKYNENAFSKYDRKYMNVYLQYVEGGSLTSIFGMKSAGIDPVDGREIFLRPNGDITYEWQAGDQVILGNQEPKAQGSFGLNASWKNFSLYATFLYEFGGQRYNSTLVSKVENANIKDGNIDRRVLSDRWQKPGDLARYKKLQAGYTEVTRPTSRFVQDYNMLSFNSITLGYDFDRELLKKARLGMLRIEVGANDIFRLSSVKLERGLDYPYANNVNVSVKLTF